MYLLLTPLLEPVPKPTEAARSLSDSSQCWIWSTKREKLCSGFPPSISHSSASSSYAKALTVLQSTVWFGCCTHICEHDEFMGVFLLTNWNYGRKRGKVLWDLKLNILIDLVNRVVKKWNEKKDVFISLQLKNIHNEYWGEKVEKAWSHRYFSLPSSH